MASLRDVLNHVGKRVRLERDGAVVGEGLAIQRGGSGFVEPKLAPRPADVVRFVDTGQAFRVEAVEPETVMGRLDHYRLTLGPA